MWTIGGDQESSQRRRVAGEDETKANRAVARVVQRRSAADRQRARRAGRDTRATSVSWSRARGAYHRRSYGREDSFGPGGGSHSRRRVTSRGVVPFGVASVSRAVAGLDSWRDG